MKYFKYTKIESFSHFIIYFSDSFKIKSAVLKIIISPSRKNRSQILAVNDVLNDFTKNV